MAGEADAVDDGLDLVIADPRAVVRVGISLVGVEQLRAEIVGPLVATGGDKLAAVLPVVDHAAGDGDLLISGRPAPRERLAVDAPRLDQHVVLWREADQSKDDLGRERKRQGPMYSAGEPVETIASSNSAARART